MALQKKTARLIVLLAVLAILFVSGCVEKGKETQGSAGDKNTQTASTQTPQLPPNQDIRTLPFMIPGLAEKQAKARLPVTGFVAVSGRKTCGNWAYISFTEFSSAGNECIGNSYPLLFASDSKTFGVWGKSASFERGFYKTSFFVQSSEADSLNDLRSRISLNDSRLYYVGQITQTQTGSVISIYHEVPLDQNGSLAFDIINFNPAAKLDVNHLLYHATTESIPENFEAVGKVDLNDWQRISAPAFFKEPSFDQTNCEGLCLTTQSSDGNEFGAFTSPFFSLEAGKLYKFSFAINSSDNPPLLRLRLNNSNFKKASMLAFYPTPGLATYNLYYETSNNPADNSVSLSLDLANFEQNKEGKRIEIQAVNAYSADINAYSAEGSTSVLPANLSPDFQEKQLTLGPTIAPSVTTIPKPTLLQKCVASDKNMKCETVPISRITYLENPVQFGWDDRTVVRWQPVQEIDFSDSNTNGWSQLMDINPFENPVFEAGMQGLTIGMPASGNTAINNKIVFGAWHSPQLNLDVGQYAENYSPPNFIKITFRMSRTDTGAGKLVPGFRLRLNSKNPNSLARSTMVAVDPIRDSNFDPINPEIKDFYLIISRDSYYNYDSRNIPLELSLDIVQTYYASEQFEKLILEKVIVEKAGNRGSWDMTKITFSESGNSAFPGWSAVTGIAEYTPVQNMERTTYTSPSGNSIAKLNFRVTADKSFGFWQYDSSNIQNMPIELNSKTIYKLYSWGESESYAPDLLYRKRLSVSSYGFSVLWTDREIPSHIYFEIPGMMTSKIVLAEDLIYFGDGYGLPVNGSIINETVTSITNIPEQFSINAQSCPTSNLATLNNSYQSDYISFTRDYSTDFNGQLRNQERTLKVSNLSFNFDFINNSSAGGSVNYSDLARQQTQQPISINLPGSLQFEAGLTVEPQSVVFDSANNVFNASLKFGCTRKMPISRYVDKIAINSYALAIEDREIITWMLEDSDFSQVGARFVAVKNAYWNNLKQQYGWDHAAENIDLSDGNVIDKAMQNQAWIKIADLCDDVTGRCVVENNSISDYFAVLIAPIINGVEYPIENNYTSIP